MNPYITRRALTKFGLATAALLPLAKILVGSAAFGAGEQLDPSDPTAKAFRVCDKVDQARRYVRQLCTIPGQFERCHRALYDFCRQKRGLIRVVQRLGQKNCLNDWKR